MQFKELSDLSSTTARLQRLSLRLPQRNGSAAVPLSLNRLMDDSMEYIGQMVASPLPEDSMVAQRIFECATTFSRWENEHAQVMRRVARQHRMPAQHRELLSGTFELIHRKSFFAYLRHNRVQGGTREILLRHFWPVQSANRGLIAEHGIFLRSHASQRCSSYLGAQVLRDAVFRQPLYDYEQMYAAYFEAYCAWVLAQAGGQHEQVTQSVVYSLKCDLGILRRTILELAARMPSEDEESLAENLFE